VTYEPRHKRLLRILQCRSHKPCQVIISAHLGRDEHLELVHRARTLAFTYDPEAKVTGWHG
jgi:hypothetical protein